MSEAISQPGNGARTCGGLTELARHVTTQRCLAYDAKKCSVNVYAPVTISSLADIAVLHSSTCAS